MLVIKQRAFSSESQEWAFSGVGFVADNNNK
jgi:hypothetical protein